MTVKIKVNRKTHNIEKIVGDIGHVVGSEQAASVSYIGIEAHNERW